VERDARSDDDDLRIATALDAARVVEDYLGSLLALTRGELDRGGGRRPFARVRQALHVQERSVVRGFAFGYGSEQLRKAGGAACGLASAVGDLEAAESETVRALAREMRDLGLVDLPDVLADEQITIRSPRLDEAFEHVHTALGAMRRVQMARTLAKMRARPPGDPPS
jgi:hypothetical protein